MCSAVWKVGVCVCEEVFWFSGVRSCVREIVRVFVVSGWSSRLGCF